MKLGAREFYATNGVQELRIRPIHHLLVTTSEQPDWPRYLSMMAPSGTIYPLSVSQGDLKVPYIPILSSGLKIQGSLVAAREIHREMLKFAAIHNIKPVIETFPMNVAGVEEAFKKLEEGAMRYRGVLVA
jgi:D-arabinose 1-dehydrogenase-like Zn-dependent alcohol dehydrogenase